MRWIAYLYSELQVDWMPYQTAVKYKYIFPIDHYLVCYLEKYFLVQVKKYLI